MGGCNLDKAAGAGDSLEQKLAQGRRRRQRSDCKVSDVQIYAAIVSNMGVVTYAAVALGILRPTLYRRIERAPRLKACLDAARAVMVRIAWQQLDVALDANAPWAIMFVVGRDNGFPMPRSGSGGSHSTEAPAKRQRATELVPQPEVAEASTLRLVRALENGEPWAIKYCLSHLDPNGACGINRLRGRNDCSADELEESSSEEVEELEEEVDPQEIRDHELASGDAQQRHAVLRGRIQLPPAPPVVSTGFANVAESLRDSNPVSKGLADTAILPDGVVSPLAPREGADEVRRGLEECHGDHPDESIARRSRSRAEQKTTLRHPGGSAIDMGLSSPNQPADVNPRFSEPVSADRVDEPDAKAFRLAVEKEPHRPAAPPVSDFDDDEETDELFRQIREMALAFQAAAAPPIPGKELVQKPDIDEFRRLLERGRARLPPAPPVNGAD